MNDIEAQTQKDRFLTAFNLWMNILGLGWWEIEILYRREPFDPYPDGFQPYMKVSSRWQYARAQIEVSLPSIAEMDDGGLEKMVIHELSHILINEMRATGDDLLDHEERVAEMLTRAFIWTRNHFTKEDIGDQG